MWTPSPCAALQHRVQKLPGECLGRRKHHMAQTGCWHPLQQTNKVRPPARPRRKLPAVSVKEPILPLNLRFRKAFFQTATVGSRMAGRACSVRGGEQESVQWSRAGDDSEDGDGSGEGGDGEGGAGEGWRKRPSGRRTKEKLPQSGPMVVKSYRMAPKSACCVTT